MRHIQRLSVVLRLRATPWAVVGLHLEGEGDERHGLLREEAHRSGIGSKRTHTSSAPLHPIWTTCLGDPGRRLRIS